MKFTVKELSYIFGSLYEAGSVVDYPDDKLPRDADGKVRFEKLSNLECLEKKPVEPVAPEKPVQADGGADLTDEEKQEIIINTVKGFDASDDKFWTTDGKPKLEEIEASAGFKVNRKLVHDVTDGYTRPIE